MGIFASHNVGINISLKVSKLKNTSLGIHFKDFSVHGAYISEILVINVTKCGVNIGIHFAFWVVRPYQKIGQLYPGT